MAKILDIYNRMATDLTSIFISGSARTKLNQGRVITESNIRNVNESNQQTPILFDAGTQNIDPRIPYLKKLVTQYTKLYIIIKNSRVF